MSCSSWQRVLPHGDCESSTPCCTSGLFETTAVVLGLMWLWRSVSRHSKRTLLLIDAEAVLRATAKGNSCAPFIRRGEMRVAVLLLASDLQSYYGYIPSEENPADTPSRGVIRPWRRQRKGRKVTVECSSHALSTDASRPRPVLFAARLSTGGGEHLPCRCLGHCCFEFYLSWRRSWASRSLSLSLSLFRCVWLRLYGSGVFRWLCATVMVI